MNKLLKIIMRMQDSLMIFSDGPVSPSYVRGVVEKCVNDASRSVKSEELQTQYLVSIVTQPTLSLRTIVAAVGTVKSTMHNILKQHKLYLCKIHLVLKLNEYDPHHRLQFCEAMKHLIDTQPISIGYVPILKQIF